MSREIVREHIAAFRSDPPRALSFLDAHHVWDGSRTAGLETGNVHYGPDALDALASRYRGAFEAYDYEVERFEDLGAGSCSPA